MNWRSYIIVISLSIYSLCIFGQQNNGFQIKGRITTAGTDTKLPLVNIFNITRQNGTVSDKQGEFSIILDTLPTLLQFTYVGYEPLAIWITEEGDKWIDIKLHPYFATLPDVVISAKPIIETITKPTYTVRDYEFYEDKILLATLPGRKSGNALVLIDEDGNGLDSVSIKHIRHFESLHKSCLENIHMVTRFVHQEIAIDSNRITFISEGPRKEFSRVVEPCIAATDSLLIYQFRFCIGQVIRFKAYEIHRDHSFLFAEVANEENMGRRYREELAGVVGYIDYLNISWEEKQLELRKAMENDYLLKSKIDLFYKPINIPVFQNGQDILLFNHLENQIQIYNEKGDRAGGIPITFQKEKKWEGVIIFDELLGDAYTQFDHPKGKVIRKIDLDDGTLGRPILIDCAMVENIKVNNGHLYYLESGSGIAAYNRVLRKVKLN